MSSREQFETGYNNARADGNKEAAQFFANGLQQMEREEAKVKEDNLSAVYDMHYDQMGEGEKFMEGVTNGINNVGGGIMDLYYRATGNDDGLSMLQGRMDAREEKFKELSARSITADVGNFVGEVLPAIPLGLGIGSAVAKTGLTGYRAAMATGAAEEGIYNFVTEEGDFKERAQQGATGLVTGTAFGATAEGISRGASKIVNRLNPSTPKPSASQEELATAQKFSQDWGGYTVNAGDALVNTAEINAKDRLLASGGDASKILLDAESKAERGLYDTAESLAGDNTKATTISRESTQNDFVSTLRTIEGEDKAASSAAYNSWLEGSEAVRSMPLNSQLMNQELRSVLSLDLSMQGDIGTFANNLQTRLKQAGLLNVKAQGQMGLNTKEGITLDGYQKLIENLNRLYDPKMSSQSKKLFGSVRAALENNVDDAVAKSGMGAEDLALYRAGRKEMAEYKTRWETSWGKYATKKDPVNDQFLKEPKAVFDSILSTTQAGHLEDIKKRMTMDPKGKIAWDSMSDFLILDAIEHAKKGGRDLEGGGKTFNEANFAKKLDKLSPEAQAVIFGKRAKGLNNLIKAAALRNPKVSQQTKTAGAGLNTNVNYGVAASRVAFPGLMAQTWAAGRAVFGVLDNVSKRFEVNRAKHMADGKITEAGKKDLAAAYKAAWEDRYAKSPALLGHANLATELFYQGVQEGLYDPFIEDALD